ncbi:MAG: cyclic nucleotide-binding domain-containing protein [Pseudomonadota bacterium]
MSTVAESMSLLNGHGWAGLGGIFLYVLAYGLLQLGYLRSDTFTFCLLNAFAGICVLFSLSEAFNLYSAIVQLIWIALSIAGLARLIGERRAIFFTPHEQSYLDQNLGKMSKADARKLLDQATIMSINEGTVLTTEGEEITHLAYLLEGEARVFVKDREIANLTAGSYIGDVTYETPQPATATVVLSSPAWAICFEIDKLRGFLQKNPRIKNQLLASTSRSVKSKLKKANQKASAEKSQAEAGMASKAASQNSVDTPVVASPRAGSKVAAKPAAPDEVRRPLVEEPASMH